MPRRKAPQPAAGCPATCKRKLAEIDPLPVDCISSLTEIDPPPVDRISSLSNDLLREIIVLLPTNEGCRTQALASRWRHLWLSGPLNLDCCDLAPSTPSYHGRSNVSMAISRVLPAHPGPVRRLCARTHHLDDETDDAWLFSTVLDSLQELEFTGGPMQRLPTSIFRFSETLLVMSIVNCNLPDDIINGLHFPQLKKLGLERVSVSETSLHGLITRCPVLEFLLVHSSSGFRRLRINSHSLTRLCVRIDPNRRYVTLPLDEISIDNAPRLQRLIYLYSIWDHEVSIYYAPKVETMYFLNNLQNFAEYVLPASRVIQESTVDNLTTAARTVKSLSINMDHLNLDKIVDLMKLFPCLEKLHVKSAKPRWRPNWWRRKHQNFIRSHDIHVKTLVLEPYLGTLCHVNFATFFVLNARKLELMTFQVKDGVLNDGFLSQQYKNLQLDNKASRGAKFHFTTTSCQRAVFEPKHLHDFDLNDPFLDGR